MRREALKGHLDLLLLSILETGSAHGYAVIAELRERSGGEFDLPEGTVYPALHRLEDAGLVASRWSNDTPRPRRVYRLTGRGRRELERAERDWRRFAHAIDAVVGGTA